MKNFRIYFVFVLTHFLSIIAAAQPYSPPSGSPLANHEHPRLFFTKDKLAGIQQYVDRYEAERFQTYVHRLDGAIFEKPGEKDRNYLIMDAVNYAFLCAASASGNFTNYTFGNSAEAYAKLAFEHTVEIANRIKNSKLKETSHCNIFRSKDQGGYINMALGVTYDWCFDYLSLAQKQAIADAIILSYSKRDDDTDPDSKMKLGLSLLAQCHQVGIGGLAMWGDPLGDAYTEIVQEMLNGVKWLWIDRVFKMGEVLFEGTGGWGEGANYFAGATTHALMYAGGLSSAINENIVSNHGWMRDLPKYLYFYQMPMRVKLGKHDGYYSQRNDTVDLRYWETTGSLQQITPIIAAIKHEHPEIAGFYKWIIEKSKYRFTKNTYDEHKPRLYWLFYKFLWGIEDVAATSAEAVDLQTSYRFGLGDVILKSDLFSDDATKINFYTPKYYLPRHADSDHSSFTIFKHGTLAIDAGIAKGSSHLPKSKRSRTAVYHIWWPW